MARECHAEIWEKLRDDLALMTPAKAREYVREAAADSVLAEVAPVMQRHRIRSALLPQVAAEAIDQLIEMVAKDLARSRPQRGSKRRAA